MPTNHVTKQLEPYLENRLSFVERQRVEKHLADCPACAYRLFHARRITNELKPILKKTLGQPMPPPALHYRVREAIHARQNLRYLHFPWALSGRIINAAGTLAIVGVLSFGVLAIVRGQPTSLERVSEFSQISTGAWAIATPTPSQLSIFVKPPATPEKPTDQSLTSLGDTLPPAPINIAREEVSNISETMAFRSNPVQPLANPLPPQTVVADTPLEALSPGQLPGGTIAFPFFNGTTNIYEIQLIEADGTNRQQFPLEGVSEPALFRPNGGAYQMAYRAWGEPTTPRALLTNDLTAQQPLALTHFWEDAQPDWSPTEPRLIFASQRESDRQWRLYTVWEDGSAEQELRREGRSPTFAPDGYRFAFESCENFVEQEQCGLWLGDLENSEYGSKPFLLDGQAKSPDWGPIGEEIVYMANPDGNWDLYLTDSEGRTPRRLTDSPAIDGLPVWSPDSQWIAFLSDRDGHWGIWLLDVEKTGPPQLLVSLDEGHFSPPQQPPYQERYWWDEQLSWVQ